MPGSLRTTALIAGLGVAFDVAVNQQAPGASVPLFVMILIAAMLTTLPRTTERIVLCSAAVLFAAFVAFRDDEALVLLDLTVVAALLGVAATGSGAVRIGVRSIAARIGMILRAALDAPAVLVAPLARTTGRTPLPALRAAAVALPILAVFTALLASADAVFASVVRLPRLRLASATGHIALSCVGALMCGTIWCAAAREPDPPSPARPPRTLLGPWEWTAVLGGMAALFSVFIGVQIAYLFGGRNRVEVTPGLTYAEYARSGFFQLLIVTALSAVVVLATWDAGRRETPRQSRVFRWLVTAIVALCGVMLTSAWKRLGLYQDTFGWTLDRFTAGLAIVWIGAVLVLLAACLWTRKRDHVGAGAVAAGLALLVAANVLGPSSFVATRNVERFNATGKLDLTYLSSLGNDAVPAIVGVLPRVPPDPDLSGWLCELRGQLDQQGWRSWNLARVRARASLHGVRCPTVSGSP